MTRRTIFAVCLIGLCLPLTLRAQDATGRAQDSYGSERPMQMTPDQMLNFYDARLSLTTDQKTQLRPILVDRQQRLRELRADSERPREKLKKLKSIMDDSDKRINAILTPDQRKQYADMEEQMKEKMMERRQERKSQN